MYWAKQRRSASLVAHLLLLHGEYRGRDKAHNLKLDEARLLYLPQAKHQLHHYSSASRRGVVQYTRVCKIEVWLAKHTNLLVFSTEPQT